jgi:hypothetical protein
LNFELLPVSRIFGAPTDIGTYYEILVNEKVVYGNGNLISVVPKPPSKTTTSTNFTNISSVVPPLLMRPLFLVLHATYTTIALTLKEQNNMRIGDFLEASKCGDLYLARSS